MNSTRRSFLQTIGLGAAALSLPAANAKAEEKVIQGFEKQAAPKSAKTWTPISDRKIRVGIAGYGVCRFGAAFGFQDHPNVEVVAVTDLIPDRCAGLAKACRCTRTYPSFEEMIKDDKIEAVFVATDAPSHARHSIEALKHGKHVASAVSAVLIAACVLTGCSMKYDITLSNGFKFTNVSKPVLDKKTGDYVFTDASGKKRAIKEARVREIAPHEKSNDKPQFQGGSTLPVR